MLSPQSPQHKTIGFQARRVPQLRYNAVVLATTTYKAPRNSSFRRKQPNLRLQLTVGAVEDAHCRFEKPKLGLRVRLPLDCSGKFPAISIMQSAVLYMQQLSRLSTTFVVHCRPLSKCAESHFHKKTRNKMPRWQARWHVESRAPTIWIRPRRQPRRVCSAV